MVKILAIGDVHFQISNLPEVNLFIERITELVKTEKPDLIVILGDILHDHEKIHTIPMNKAKEFFLSMKNHAPTYVLVGNHDACLKKGTLVRLWDGTIKKVENLIIGDELISDKGEKTKILSVFDGEDQLYEIIQNKASNYTVTKNHILTLKIGSCKNIFFDKNKNIWSFEWIEKKILEDITVNLEIKNKNFTTREEALYCSSKIKEINPIDISVKNYLKLPAKIKEKLYGFKCSNGVNWDKQEILLDPYLFGTWLSKGLNEKFSFNSTDIPLIIKWKEWAIKNNALFLHTGINTFSIKEISYTNLQQNNNTCSICKNQKFCAPLLVCASIIELKALFHKNRIIYKKFSKNASNEQIINLNNPLILKKLHQLKKITLNFSYNFSNKNNNPLKIILSKYNQNEGKNIPKEYFVNNRETRLKILAGFIDASGYTCKKRRLINIKYNYSKNENLIYNFLDLTRSLGFSSTIINDLSNNYQILLNISGNIHEIPTLSKEKFNKNINKNINKKIGIHNHLSLDSVNYLKSSIKVEKKDVCKFYGFELNGSKRFLLSDFTVTHNCNNQIFLSDNHWMNILKEWDGLNIIDKVQTCEQNGETFVMVPYVPPGRFEEALNTIGNTWKNASCIFAHQEFYGCKMGAITSLDGDKWPLDYPNVISGHIHSKDKLQKNIYYTGSALQVAFGESKQNTVAILEFNDKNYICKEIDLELPRKKSITTSMKKIADFKIPETKDKILLSISGNNITEFKAFQKSKKYKELKQAGIKVKFTQKNIESLREITKEAITKGENFQEILHSIIIKEKNNYLTAIYEQIINNKNLSPQDIIYI